MQNRVTIDPLDPQPDIIKKAGEIIRSNGVVIFPATCMYGVAANALNDEAVQKVFDLKQRPKNKPILVLVPDMTHLPELASDIPDTAKKLISAFWPGRLTIVFRAKPAVSPLLTAGTGKIGIRIPAHPVARALVRQAGIPVTGTSANLSGQASCRTTDELPKTIRDQSEMILDAGPLKGGTGSTIVDVTAASPVIVREGLIKTDQIPGL